jgi:hypothetical protein
MEFTIITLGDLETFRATLTAIAMLFNPSNTTDFVGTSDIGLGGFAAVGLLIALTVALFKGITTLKFELGELIVVVILYSALFVPKFDVILEDYYTGDVAAVDDVPLGIALPGAFISGFTTQISETLSTAFKTASSPQFAMQENGFVYPLKLLNALRNGSQSFAKKEPGVSTSVINIYKDCAFGRNGFDSKKLARSNNPWSYIKTFVEDQSITGITEVYRRDSPSGTLVTCQEAVDFTDSDIELLFDPSANPDIAASTKNPNGVSAFEEMICSNMKNVRTPNSGCPDYQAYDSAFQAIGAASGEQAKNFAITTMVASSIKNAELCASGAVDASQLARCMPMVTALEQFKEDAVGGATLFQKTMLNSMSVMLFLFYAFAPLISVLMIALGAKGLKLLGSYMMFGIWTQSWLPFATILNFYIQQKVSYDSARFGVNSPELSAAGYQAFYESVSLNLGIASDLMAATPLITLALLSGSVFALTGVANRLSGRDYYDEKANVASAVSNGAVAMNTPSFTGAAGTLSAKSNDTPAPIMNMTSALQNTRQFSQTASIENAKVAEEAVSKTLQHSVSSGKSVDKMLAISKSNGFSGSKGEMAALTAIANNTSGTMTKEQQDDAQAAIATRASTTGVTGRVGGFLGFGENPESDKKSGGGGEKSKSPVKVGPGARIGVDGYTDSSVGNLKSDSRTAVVGTGVSADSGSGVNAQGGDKRESTLQQARTVQQSLAAALRMQQSEDATDSTGVTNRLTQAMKLQDTAVTAASRSDSISALTTLDPKALVVALSNNPELADRINSVATENMADRNFASLYQENLKVLRHTDAGSTMDSRGNNALDEYAALLTLSKTSPVQFTDLIASGFNPQFQGSNIENPDERIGALQTQVNPNGEAVTGPAFNSADVTAKVAGAEVRTEELTNQAKPLDSVTTKTLIPEIPGNKSVPTVAGGTSFVNAGYAKDSAETDQQGKKWVSGNQQATGHNQRVIADTADKIDFSSVAPLISSAKAQDTYEERVKSVTDYVENSQKNPTSVATSPMLAARDTAIQSLTSLRQDAASSSQVYKQGSAQSETINEFMLSSGALLKQISDPKAINPSNVPGQVNPATPEGTGEAFNKNAAKREEANTLTKALNKATSGDFKPFDNLK